MKNSAGKILAVATIAMLALSATGCIKGNNNINVQGSGNTVVVSGNGSKNNYAVIKNEEGEKVLHNLDGNVKVANGYVEVKCKECGTLKFKANSINTTSTKPSAKEYDTECCQ